MPICMVLFKFYVSKVYLHTFPIYELLLECVTIVTVRMFSLMMNINLSLIGICGKMQIILSFLVKFTIQNFVT